MSKTRALFCLHGVLILYSFCSICSKIAASKPFFSFGFFVFYGLALMLLGIYAILWQQILKYLPLNIAFANKAVTIIWGMIWGAMLFQEEITIRMLIGVAIVIVGVLIVVTDKDEKGV